MLLRSISLSHTLIRSVHASQAFNGQHGRAYLFDTVCVLLSSYRTLCTNSAPLWSSSVNVVEGEPVDRQMTTGNHTVRDIYCVKCQRVLGWKYVRLHLARLSPHYLLHEWED